jgi:spoIIIJ-associated protein
VSRASSSLNGHGPPGPVRYEEGNSVTDTDVAESADGTDQVAIAEAEVTEESGVAGSIQPSDDLTESDSVDDTEDESVEDSDDESVEDSDDESDDESEGDESEGDESDEGADATAGGRRSRRSGTSLRRLEEEGEVAADYLEELLDITDLDGDIDIDVENGRASVAVVSEDGTDRELRRLVGTRGEVLEALQELSRLAVQAKTGERSRLMLDIAGFRAARRRALGEVGARACQEVKRDGQPVRLEPMSAFERKVVHDVVADAGLRSESEGEEPARRVVVFPAGS